MDEIAQAQGVTNARSGERGLAAPGMMKRTFQHDTAGDTIIENSEDAAPREQSGSEEDSEQGKRTMPVEDFTQAQREQCSPVFPAHGRFLYTTAQRGAQRAATADRGTDPSLGVGSTFELPTPARVTITTNNGITFEVTFPAGARAVLSWNS